ncbi:hypothetical protein J6590_097762 [Homalodisca vitripennis]|nr:hypothetical protein J6590_097762 [Homalodisca vitripennis]
MTHPSTERQRHPLTSPGPSNSDPETPQASVLRVPKINNKSFGYNDRKRPTEQWPGSECNPDATSAAAVLNYAYLQPAFLSRV